MIDYAGVVTDSFGKNAHKHDAYFGENEAEAKAWFDSDLDITPMGYTKSIYRYDTDTDTLTITHTRVVSRFLPAPVKYTEGLKNILTRLYTKEHNVVAGMLLQHSDNTVADYVGLDGSNLSFFPQSKELRRGAELIDDEWHGVGRQSTKPGRLARQIIRSDLSVTDAMIETFATRLKVLVDNTNTGVQVVHGEDIRYWYHERQYAAGTYSLGGSCMRYTKCQPFCDFYVDNPTIGLAIRTNEFGELIGRALVWRMADEHGTLLEPPMYFMDRVYADEKTVGEFERHAAKQGWWYKSVRGRTSPFDLMNNHGEIEKATIFCCVQHADHQPPKGNGYPYMDTMKFVDLKKSLVHNNKTYEHDLIMTYQDGQCKRVNRRDIKFDRWFTGEPPHVECACGCGRKDRADLLKLGQDGLRYFTRCWEERWFRSTLDNSINPVMDRVTGRVGHYNHTLTKDQYDRFTYLCASCGERNFTNERTFVFDANDVRTARCSDCTYGTGACWTCGKRHFANQTHVCAKPDYSDIDRPDFPNWINDEPDDDND